MSPLHLFLKVLAGALERLEVIGSTFIEYDGHQNNCTCIGSKNEIHRGLK